MQFLHNSEVFQNSQKSCQSFGLLLLEILLPKIPQSGHTSRKKQLDDEVMIGQNPSQCC